jgi:hypothetical protein
VLKKYNNTSKNKKTKERQPKPGVQIQRNHIQDLAQRRQWSAAQR